MCLASVAGAQQYPTKVIRMVVPFAPGGNTDIIARFIVPKMSEDLGQQIIIENRAARAALSVLTSAQKQHRMATRC